MKAYLKMCMLLIYLSALSGYLAAQITGTTLNESADSIINRTGSPPRAVIIEQFDDLGSPVQTRSCINTYSNQTVSTFLVINGCSTLVVQDVNVTNDGDLYLLAPGEITINGEFDVILGGQLNVHIQPPCVNAFTNQMVSSYIEIIGCDTLLVQDVTVTSTGDLHLSAPGDITINGVFDISLGGQLNVNMIQSPPPPPPGNTMQTAINIGTFGIPFQYSDSQNTTDYTNDYVGQPTNDVFYVFTITTEMNIAIKHCDSQIATYLHLLDASGTSIAYNDGYSGAGGCTNSSHAYLKQYLTPGTYYIVSEGYSANGIIQTEVIGEIPQSSFEYTYDASGNRISRTFVP